MIDNRTTHLDLPLPDPANALPDDVMRIKSALSGIDTKAGQDDQQAKKAALYRFLDMGDIYDIQVIAR